MQGVPVNEILRNFAHAIDKSQNLPREDIQHRQGRLLEKLCVHARRYVPYYRDNKRLDPLFRADGTFDRAHWNEIPILTRAEAQANEAALRAESVPPEMLPLSDDRTSGSTGTPLRIKRSFMQAVASSALFDRAVRWNKAGPVRRLAVTDVVPVEEHHGARDVATPGHLVAQVIVPAHFDPVAQLDLIGQTKPSHIIAFPNLVRSWLQTGCLDRLAGLRTMFTTGEVLQSEFREQLERELKIQIINLYSTTETGPIAVDGPDGRMRVSEETLFLEQPSGAVNPSQPVRTVATPFYAYAMPLIRYATGDYIRYSARRSREAAGLRRLEAVLGRERGLFRRRDGTRIWPAVHGDIIGDFIPLRGWQLVQESLDQLVMRVVTPGVPDKQAVVKCCEAISQMVPGFNVRLEVVDRIDDGRASGKRFESCVSLID